MVRYYKKVTYNSIAWRRGGQGQRKGAVRYPLQEPLWPAPHPINPDAHLGKGSDVQDLHDEGVILFPLKPEGGA